MTNKIRYILIYLLIFQTSCFEEELMPDPIQLTSDSKDMLFFHQIWEKNYHSAFTDLIEYNGIYYCCFREAYKHIPYSKETFGTIRVLKSNDGVLWTSKGIIINPNYDLRDPKFSIDSNNNLSIIMGAFILENGYLVFSKTKLYTLNKDDINSDTEFTASLLIDLNLNLDRFWLWRVTWHKGIAYGIAYNANAVLKSPPYLLKSNDGINYEIVAFLENVGVDANESDILFIEDDMLVSIRNNKNNGYIGSSSYPYTIWNWKYSNMPIHSPKLFSIDEQIFISGRIYGGKHAIAYLNKDKKYVPIYILPSAGDSSYAGAILVDDELWMSYYTTLTDKSSIYFAKFSKHSLLKQIK